MAPLSVLVLFGLVVNQIQASGFLGSSISFSYRKERPDGSFEVDFYYREYRNESCEDQLTWQCTSGDCGNLIKSEVLTAVANSSVAAWCQSEGFMTRNVSSNSPFILRDSGCCWDSNLHGARDWSLSTLVDVGRRTDTHMPNRSPISTTVPKLRIPQDCQLSIELLVHDPDGDEVRCKFSEAGGNSSCSSCHSHPNINLNQDHCVLHGNGSLPIGTHVFEMVLEDYPKEDITITYPDGTSSIRRHLNKTAMENPSPLSQIPLQFTVEVLAPLNGCLNGATKPHFLKPTPSHEEVHITAVGHKHQLTLRAQSTESRIVDFQISGPQNISKFLQIQSDGIAVATVEWTPQPSDTHRSVPVCFTADTATSQSEMRCVMLMVKESLPLTGDGEVSCKENIITVTVSKASIPGINDTWLHMIDPTCSLTSNDTHIMGTISINTCGTQMEEDGDFILFKNAITSFEEPAKIITRRGHVTIGFSCRYPKEINVYSHYLNKKSDYVFTEAGFGSFSYSFEVFTDANFTTAIAPTSFPVEYDLLEMIYMGIKSQSALANTQMFVESCRATPTVNPKGPLYYDLISNGCLVDETMKEFPHGQTNFNFEIQAFKFTGEFDEVFISCSVILCEAGNPNSRCAQGCVEDASRRRKRESALETASHTVTVGPFRMARGAQRRSDEEQKVSKDGSAPASSLNEQTNATTFVLAGLLIASLVLLVGVILYKNKKYRTLSQQSLLS